MSPTDTQDLQALFVEVTGDEGVTEEQVGSDRREAGDEPDRLAGRTEDRGLSSSIETPEDAY